VSVNSLPAQIAQATPIDVSGTWQQHVPASFAREALAGAPRWAGGVPKTRSVCSTSAARGKRTYGKEHREIYGIAPDWAA